MEETNIGDNVNLIMLTIRVELQQRLGGDHRYPATPVVCLIVNNLCDQQPWRKYALYWVFNLALFNLPKHVTCLGM